MRLGQLARKYDVSQQQIISFLKEIEPTLDTLHSNSKLNEQTEALVAKRFEILSDTSVEDLEDQSEGASQEIKQNTLEPEVADIEEKEDTKEVTPSNLEEPLPLDEVQKLQKEEEVAIETDQLMELLESEETSVDLSKITLIKAPKKELDGLKVVGKIELPEQKDKTEEEPEQTEEPKPDRSSRQRRRLVSDEELEERRLKAKRKKEENEARQEERRKAKEKKRKKSVREAHYQQKMQQIKASQPKQSLRTEPEPELFEEEEPRPEPRTIFGKFWRWLNTP